MVSSNPLKAPNVERTTKKGIIHAMEPYIVFPNSTATEGASSIIIGGIAVKKATFVKIYTVITTRLEMMRAFGKFLQKVRTKLKMKKFRPP